MLRQRGLLWTEHKNRIEKQLPPYDPVARPACSFKELTGLETYRSLQDYIQRGASRKLMEIQAAKQLSPNRVGDLVMSVTCNPWKAEADREALAPKASRVVSRGRR